MHSSVLFVEIPAEHIALVSHRYFNIPGPKHITYEPEQGSHTTNDEQLKKKKKLKKRKYFQKHATADFD